LQERTESFFNTTTSKAASDDSNVSDVKKVEEVEAVEVEKG